MNDLVNFSNQRQFQRISTSLPIQLSFGTQITLEGQLKDISFKSAFIKLKGSIYMEENDELTFLIKLSSENLDDVIQGAARISRIAKGEGIVIYFTKIDEASSNRLKKLIER